MSDKVNQKSTFPSTGKLTSQAAVSTSAQKSHLKRKVASISAPLLVRADISCGLQEDKLVTVSSVVAPPQFARWQNVGGGSSVAALTLKSVILAATLYEGEQRVPLL